MTLCLEAFRGLVCLPHSSDHYSAPGDVGLSVVTHARDSAGLIGFVISYYYLLVITLKIMLSVDFTKQLDPSFLAYKKV